MKSSADSKAWATTSIGKSCWRLTTERRSCDAALFLLACRKIRAICFPGPDRTPDNYVTCEQAIGDLPSRQDELGSETDSYLSAPLSDYAKMMRGTQNVLHNHVATNHTDHVKSVIALVPPGGNYKDLPPGVGTLENFMLPGRAITGRSPQIRSTPATGITFTTSTIAFLRSVNLPVCSPSRTTSFSAEPRLSRIGRSAMLFLPCWARQSPHSWRP